MHCYPLQTPQDYRKEGRNFPTVPTVIHSFQACTMSGEAVGFYIPRPFQTSLGLIEIPTTASSCDHVAGLQPTAKWAHMKNRVICQVCDSI